LRAKHRLAGESAVPQTKNARPKGRALPFQLA